MPLDVNSSRSTEPYGIFHPGKDEDVKDQYLGSLPAHVNIVKDGLLEFNRFLGLEAMILALRDEKSSEDDEDVIPLYAYKTDGLKASHRARDREFLENAQGLAVGAQRLESRFAQDGEWRTLFRSAVTNLVDDAHCFGSHQLSTIACAENELWDIDLGLSRPSHANPKPDMYCGFPIHNAEHHKLARFRNDPSFQNFTVDSLSQLAMKGLRCVPVSSSLAGVAETKKDSAEPQVPFLCFPWCIIQLKGVEKATEIEEIDKLAFETSCKASAAATGALAMLETLARFADVKQDGQHIPPVIAITSIGQNATVWLAYSEIIDDQYRDHKMMGIWNGCISKIWDAIQFCRILDNLFFWSQHVLRPQVSHYIDQWRLRYCPKVHNLHFRLEKDLETAELVHQIQDRLSSLGTSPNSHLPELIQQAVIFQEVMRLNLRKTELLSKDSPYPNAQDEIEISKPIPFHPKANSSAVGAFGNSAIEEGEQQGVESKGEEDEKEGRLGGDSGDSDICYSARSKDKPTLQPEPRDKNATVLADLPVSCEKSLSRDSTATEDKLGRRSNNPEFSAAIDIASSVAPSDRPRTSELVSKSESRNDSSTDEKLERELYFSYPYKFKASDFDFDKERFLLHSLKSKSVDSKEPTALKDSASRKNSNNQPRSTNTSSPPSNPFIARSFELSFYVKYWWCSMPIDACLPQAGRESEPHSALHTESTLSSREDEAGRIVRSEAPKRRKPGRQLAEILEPPFSRVKIPWKDSKFIIVRLPPVMPVSASKKLP